MTKFKARDEFVVGKHGIGWISERLLAEYKDTEFEAKSLPTFFQKLPRYMNDGEIESELKPGTCDLGDVLAFLDNAPEESKDGYFNLFYLPSFVVGVYWVSDGRDWGVDTWDRGGLGWLSSSRVFSPATGTKTLEYAEPSDSLALELSKLTEQVKRLADHLEPKKVSKKKK